VIWKKSRLTTWTADGGFRIVEMPGGEQVPFVLTSRVADPVCFPTIQQAKAVAELKNKLALAEQDNARLRSELDTREGRWPDAEPRAALHRAFIAEQDAAAAEQDARDAWQEADDAEPPDLQINHESA